VTQQHRRKSIIHGFIHNKVRKAEKKRSLVISRAENGKNTQTNRQITARWSKIVENCTRIELNWIVGEHRWRFGYPRARQSKSFRVK
jgi:hypothetical protein